jgi:FMN-dependent oxidoreductase (nitrilotriacetate monooxygenase family)
MTMPKKQMKLAAYYLPPGAYAAGWRLPDATADSDMGIQHYVRFVQTAERGKMDCVLFPDRLAVAGSEAIGKRDRALESAAHVAQLEPLELLPALAMLTKNIGLVGTTTTAYGPPYHAARRYATLDHISGGRAGWNLVTSQIADEAKNFGLDEREEPSLAYEQAAEFHDICVGLWDSWDEDAVLRDKASGRYYDPAKVHVLNHKGRFFSVRGPLNVARCPQGRPVIAQDGSSEPARELAGRTAELLFTAPRTLGEAQAFYADLKGRAARHGRGPNDLKIMPGIVPIVARTDAEARALYDRLQSFAGNEAATDGFIGGTEGAGHRVVHGSPATLADTMQQWLENGAADGFTILFPYFPTPADDFVGLVIPELQRRGIFRTAYEGSTLRENLELNFPHSVHEGPKEAAL